MDHFHAGHQQALCKTLPSVLLQVHHNMKTPPRQLHTTHPRVPVQPIQLVHII
ncbi:hypothetical protein Hanom_Chr09g00816221 [Helianthus anomalus]